MAKRLFPFHHPRLDLTGFKNLSGLTVQYYIIFQLVIVLGAKNSTITLPSSIVGR